MGKLVCLKEGSEEDENRDSYVIVEQKEEDVEKDSK